MDIIGGLLHVVLLFLWISSALSYDNIALNKPASQSSSSENLVIDPPPASRANDGDGTNMESMKDNSCLNTKKGETQAWWRVDLGDIHWIDQVYITYRDWRVNSFTSAGRLGGFSIYVSDTENWWNGYRCYKNEEKPSVSRTGYPYNAVGRYVTIYNDRNATDVPFPDYYYKPTTDKAVLELCEVEIDGCSSGTFGSNCNQNCSTNCATRDICTYNNGTCLYGCDPGFYLPDCSSPCSVNCYSNTCERSNGDCIGGCKTGYYTSTCSQKCPDNCKDNECDQSTGVCNSCKAGWRGDKCDQPCSFNLFGKGCNDRCGLCYNGTCHHVTGICPHGCVQDLEPPSCNIIEAQKETSELNSTALILGLVLGAVIISSVGIIAVLVRKLRGAIPTGNQSVDMQDTNNYDAITSRDPEPNHIYSVMSGSSGKQEAKTSDENNYTPIQPDVQDAIDNHH